jgi:hypothetical protein
MPIMLPFSGPFMYGIRTVKTNPLAELSAGFIRTFPGAAPLLNRNDVLDKISTGSLVGGAGVMVKNGAASGPVAPVLPKFP